MPSRDRSRDRSKVGPSDGVVFNEKFFDGEAGHVAFKILAAVAHECGNVQGNERNSPRRVGVSRLASSQPSEVETCPLMVGGDSADQRNDTTREFDGGPSDSFDLCCALATPPGLEHPSAPLKKRGMSSKVNVYATSQPPLSRLDGGVHHRIMQPAVRSASALSVTAQQHSHTPLLLSRMMFNCPSSARVPPQAWRSSVVLRLLQVALASPVLVLLLQHQLARLWNQQNLLVLLPS